MSDDPKRRRDMTVDELEDPQSVGLAVTDETSAVLADDDTVTYDDETRAQENALTMADALIELARAVRSMVEDGHPDDVEWFEIMSRHLAAVNDVLAMVDLSLDD